MSDPQSAAGGLRGPSLAGKFGWAGLIVVGVGAVLAIGAGFGYRGGLWPLPRAFGILQVAFWTLLGGGLLSLSAGIWLVRRHERSAFAWLAVVAAIAVLSVPLYHVRIARAVPPIHDITTDTENPPLFADALPLRENAPNGSDYGGEEVARQQRAAYPDIRPIRLDVPPEAAYSHILETAEDMGWEIIGASPSEGRIEATDTTFWFGFKDDIAIRITGEGDGAGSRVDVRSVSRVGRSDVGANARRIRAFRDALNEG